MCLVADTASFQYALSVREFLSENKVTIEFTPSILTRLAPYDYFLFPKLNMAFKGEI
jgi:hypothetical protein